MNGPVYGRTVRDQVRFRNLFFLVAALGITFLATAGPLWEFDYGEPRRDEFPTTGQWRDAHDEWQGERDKLTATDAWALALTFPVLNAGLVLAMMAGFAGVSATAKEWADRTALVLFSKPVPRWKIVTAKLLGAYTAVALTILAMALTVLVTGLAMDLSGLGAGTFWFAVWWTLLAAIPITAVGAWAGLLIRRPLTGVAAAIGLLILLFPLVAVSGFAIAEMDDDFRAEGNVSWAIDEMTRQCRNEEEAVLTADYRHGGGEDAAARFAAATAAYDAMHACRLRTVGAVDDYYTSRGHPAPRYYYEQAYCRMEQDFHNQQADGRHITEDDCYEDWRAREERTPLYAEKFASFRVDWSRYANPLGLVNAWQTIVGFDARDSNNTILRDVSIESSLQFFTSDARGFTTRPASAGMSVVALVAHGAAWTTLAVAAVTRRDLA